MHASFFKILLMTVLLASFPSVLLAQDGETAEASSPPAVDAATDTPIPDTSAEAPESLKTADDAYDLKLRNLEEKVNQLKEKIFRSKSRLMLLQETILHGVIAGSKAVVTHKNELGTGFKLESVAYYLDGSPIFGKINLDGSLDHHREIEIYSGTVQPGNHILSAYLVYRGDSSVFVYVEGVQVKLKSSYTFKAEEGKIAKIAVVGYDKGGITAKFQDRPAVKFDFSYSDLTEEDQQEEQSEESEVEE